MKRRGPAPGGVAAAAGCSRGQARLVEEKEDAPPAAPLAVLRAPTLSYRDVERGVHPVEARIGGRHWLLSNPVHLR
jgi:hypothetical protein